MKALCLPVIDYKFPDLASEVQLDFFESQFGKSRFESLNADIDFIQEMLTIIEQERGNQDHERFGMFVLVIMSHGDANLIYGTNLKPVKLDDIYDRLAAANFRAMAGKPKLIIIQACSGGECLFKLYLPYHSPQGIVLAQVKLKFKEHC